MFPAWRPGCRGCCSNVLGALPFTLALPYANLFRTAVLTIVIGLPMASAFPAILVYAHGIAFVYQFCSYLPAIGLVAWLLPNLERKRA